MRVALLCLLAVCAVPAFADTAIETETAQIGAKGDIAFSQSYEYEKAKDGSSSGTLTQFEYGITSRAEILIEPFFYVTEHPDGEPKTSGLGDLEITPSYMVVVEKGMVPAVLTALKVKVPTGDKDVGGSGEYDYFPYLIFGQHYAGWTFNANAGVNFAKHEENSGYHKTFVWDLEAEREIAHGLVLFAEVFSAEEPVKTVSAALEYQLTDVVNLFTAVGYNEDKAVVVRSGFNLTFY